MKKGLLSMVNFLCPFVDTKLRATNGTSAGLVVHRENDKEA